LTKPPRLEMSRRPSIAAALITLAAIPLSCGRPIRPDPDSARWTHEQRSRLYLRTGQYDRLLANLDEWARRFPDDPQLPPERADIEQFRGLPDQAGGPVRPSTLRHGAGSDFTAPIRINGKPATYLLDTGAWLSVMTASEAKRLGMTIHAGTGNLSDPSGNGVAIRTAVANEVVVGSTTFQHVSFGILPDVEPWASMPTGRGGILGIPILLHFGCIRWTRDGTWELGCAPSVPGVDRANLAFSGNHLLLASKVEGQEASLTLDTGAETTDLNANFAKKFGDLVRDAGAKDTTTITGLGGTAVIESVTLPEVGFLVGDARVLLRPAHVTMQENAALGGQCCVGNIGLDLLLQTGAVSIDFTRMTLRLR
jgi:predicted aspartyl protease